MTSPYAELQLAHDGDIAILTLDNPARLNPISATLQASLLRAIADNPDLARLSGIRSQRLMVLLWALAGALAGVGGVLLGVKSVVMPELGWELLLPAFAAMILGGIGSPGGAVAGALLMGVGQELRGLEQPPAVQHGPKSRTIGRGILVAGHVTVGAGPVIDRPGHHGGVDRRVGEIENKDLLSGHGPFPKAFCSLP